MERGCHLTRHVSQDGETERSSGKTPCLGGMDSLEHEAFGTCHYYKCNKSLSKERWDTAWTGRLLAWTLSTQESVNTKPVDTHCHLDSPVGLPLTS